MNGDKYYGDAVRLYDVDRCHTLRWAREQLAVNDFVTAGPVLDVPIGTGRYCTIYRDKRLTVTGVDISPDMLAEAKRHYPHITVQKGSVFELPFADKSFGTVVCSRLLDWLYPDDMRRAVKELRRVGRTVVLTIRHGMEGERVNYTHPLASFYEAIDGLYIEGRRLTETTKDGTEEMFKLRQPIWADVLAQFDYKERIFHEVGDEVQRIADAWFSNAKMRSRPVNAETAKVTAEYWTADELGAVIDSMSEIVDHKVKRPESRYSTSLLPRHEGGPVTILKVGEHKAVLDGRRRMNLWRQTPGRYPVLLVEIEP